MSDTPRTDDANTYIRTRRDFTITDHQVWQEHGEHLERELTESNQIIRQQQLLQEENLRLQERIKRLEETLEAVTDKLDNAWGIYMQFKEAKP